jgi:heparosan-N-sulfate-glucuronate 5-epimerase
MEQETRAEDEAVSGRAETLIRGAHLPPALIFTLAGWLVVYATIGERIYLPRGPGGAVPLAGVITLLLAAVILIASSGARALVAEGMRKAPWLVAFVSVWIVLGLTGPVVGYPIHTVFTALVPLSIAALCALGLILCVQRRVTTGSLASALTAIAWIQFVAGAMQMLWYTSTLGLPPQRWLYIWDTRTSIAYGVEQIAGRSVGLYVNPNTYSLLGALLVVLALTLDLPMRARLALAFPAAGIVMLGASRSAVLALAIVLIPLAVSRMRRMERPRMLRTAAAIAGAALLLFGVSRLTGNTLIERFSSRWAYLPDLFSAGVAADPNAAGRVDAWGRILPYWGQNPFGTFGPPQMAISTFTDNDYITLLMQGGIILLVTYVGFLVSTLVRRNHSPLASSVAPLIAIVALTGVTQTSIVLAPALALFWPAMGTTLVPREQTLPDGTGPRRTAASERRAVIRRRGVNTAISATLVLIVLVAVATRVTGRGFAFPEDVTPDHTRPRASAGASTTVPGWRVDLSDGLGMYYVDLPSSEVPDRIEDLADPPVSEEERERLAEEWRPATAVVRGQTQVIPVSVAIAGLRDYTRYVATGDERFAEFSRSAADWLVEAQESDGSWRYRYAIFDLAPGWTSANMQSTAISLLARVYEDSGDARYLESALRAYEFMMKPVQDGGTLGVFRDRQPVLEGYSNSRIAEHALSGALVGIFGVHDLAFVTEDPDIQNEYRELARSLSANIDSYDFEGWSRYSLGVARGPSSHVFHRLYIVELRVLAVLSGDERFEQQADRWEASLVEWVASLEESQDELAP